MSGTNQNTITRDDKVEMEQCDQTVQEKTEVLDLAIKEFECLTLRSLLIEKSERRIRDAILMGKLTLDFVVLMWENHHLCLYSVFPIRKDNLELYPAMVKGGKSFTDVYSKAVDVDVENLYLEWNAAKKKNLADAAEKAEAREKAEAERAKAERAKAWASYEAKAKAKALALAKAWASYEAKAKAKALAMEKALADAAERAMREVPEYLLEDEDFAYIYNQINQLEMNEQTRHAQVIGLLRIFDSNGEKVGPAKDKLFFLQHARVHWPGLFGQCLESKGLTRAVSVENVCKHRDGTPRSQQLIQTSFGIVPFKNGFCVRHLEDDRVVQSSRLIACFEYDGGYSFLTITGRIYKQGKAALFIDASPDAPDGQAGTIPSSLLILDVSSD